MKCPLIICFLLRWSITFYRRRSIYAVVHIPVRFHLSSLLLCEKRKRRRVPNFFRFSFHVIPVKEEFAENEQTRSRWFGALPNHPACQSDRDLEVNCQPHACDRADTLGKAPTRVTEEKAEWRTMAGARERTWRTSVRKGDDTCGSDTDTHVYEIRKG